MSLLQFPYASRSFKKKLDMAMIIFCDFCLSSVCIHDLNIHQSMGMLLQFLRVFPYAFKISVGDLLRDF